MLCSAELRARAASAVQVQKKARSSAVCAFGVILSEAKDLALDFSLLLRVPIPLCERRTLLRGVADNCRFVAAYPHWHRPTRRKGRALRDTLPETSSCLRFAQRIDSKTPGRS
jgi:hypothetical protein